VNLPRAAHRSWSLMLSPRCRSTVRELLMPDRFVLKDSKGRQYIAIKTEVGSDRDGKVASASMRQVADAPSYKLVDGRELSYRPESDQFEIVETGDALMRTLS
jgi:hypothetical protein